MTPEQIIDTLAMQPHPEGGWYKETWRDPTEPRSMGTAIYFLLEAHQSSQRHRVDADEMWHWYAGSPMELYKPFKGTFKAGAPESSVGNSPARMFTCSEGIISPGTLSVASRSVRSLTKASRVAPSPT